MLILVGGGSGSGKSEFAENKLLEISKAEARLQSQSQSQGESYYVATMINYGDEETNRRIDRHSKMRAEKNFKTIECPYDFQLLKFENSDNILLECMSNLVANEIFAKQSKCEDKNVEGDVAEDEAEDVVEKIIGAIKALEVNNILIVTNDIFADGIEYNDEMKQYMQILGKLNRKIAEIADEVYEVVYGIPILLKGESDK